MNIIPQILKAKGSGNIHGVERLIGVADPSFPYLIGTKELLANLPYHNLIRACKTNASRQIVNYLNQTDWTKNADGTASVLDGSDGLDVMIDYPGLWMIFGGSNPTYEYWIISDKPFIWRGEAAIWYDRFIDTPDYCTIDRTTGASRSVYTTANANLAGSGAGATASGLGYPRTAISRYGYEAAASLKGSGWNGALYGDLMYMLCMLYIEYHTKNLQGIFGVGASTWGGTQWNAYNGYYPAIKIFEGQLALSGSFVGKMTGTFTKTFGVDTNGSALYTTQLPVWRGKVVPYGHLWWWRSGIEFEVQSVASGGNSYLWTQLNPALIDANRSDSDFSFKNTYKNMGSALRIDGWIKDVIAQTFIGNSIGAGQTTYACSYNWNSVGIPGSGIGRLGVLFGANLYNGGVCAVGSARANCAPSYTYTNFGGGFRANVSG